MSRPPHLPDYENPPLTEVVLGMQFAPPGGYQQIYAKEVWELFRQDFPKVKEQPPLPPIFETFGLPQGPEISFGILEPTHDRFWFLSEAEDELIQFQQDRLLHNWRKVGDETKRYPRFENMIVKFEDELKRLEEYFTSFGSTKLEINQCELTYVNHILLTEKPGDNIDSWIRLLHLDNINPDNFTFVYRKIIKDKDGKPRGRLICESSTAINKSERPIIVLNITVRGAPQEPSIVSAINFIKEGREILVKSFDEITTDFAHEKWGRK